MKAIIQVGALAILAALSATAQPVVNAVLNNASYALPPLSNSGIAQGSLFAVFGTNLATGNLTATSFPIQTTMGGTSVRVTVGGTSVDCLMIYTTQNQIGAVLPSNTPVGEGTLTVTSGGRASNSRAITVVRSAFGIFTANQQGSGPGSIQIVRSETDRPAVTLTNPARPGDAMIIWGTGLGPITGNDAAAPVPADLPVNVEVYVGGQRASVSYRGRSGCCTGIDQIVFTVPNNVEGCYVPVVVKIDNVVSNFSTISVARPGQNVCSDSTGLPPEQLAAAGSSGRLRLGTVNLVRFAGSGSFSGVTASLVNDIASASFVSYDLNQLQSSQTIGGAQLVSLGSCTVATYRASDENSTFVDPIQPTGLDAGPQITLNRSGLTKNLAKRTEGHYQSTGQSITIPGFPSQPPSTGDPAFLEPGQYTISGVGGAAVERFTFTMNVPALLNWTNQVQISDVTRANGVTVNWTGGDPNGNVIISGSSDRNQVGATFTCLAPASAGTFTVPSYVLLLLPPTTADDPGSLAVGGISAQQRFTAGGIDYGLATVLGLTSKLVPYR